MPVPIPAVEDEKINMVPSQNLYFSGKQEPFKNRRASL